MDFFSRQLSVPDWNQTLIEQQRALVLGVGAIGCSIARNLCRLGVQELVLVDYDVVAASNINRQVLFSCGDVGRRKVEAGEEGLQRHNIRTKIIPVHCNAVTEWRRVVELAQNSTVIFNGIDYGEYFDYALTSLCTSLSLPYISASSYGHTAIAECYPPIDCPKKGPCWACNNSPAQTELLQQITPDKIRTLDTLEFLPKDVHMPSNQDVGSSILPCTTAATIAMATWVNSLHGYSAPHWISCDFAMFQMFSFPVEPNPACLVCRNAPRYSAGVVSVYFGTSPVRLSAVSGETLVRREGWITNPQTEPHFESARQRFHPCASLGSEYTNCYVPAIPAAELEIVECSKDCSVLPEALRKPLLKTQDGTVTAIRSGNRSAIYPTNAACYRLKGCGNYVDAEGLQFPFPSFPLQKLEAKEGIEIKGCCFKHTAATEQYMSEQVGEILEKHGIPVGNRPVAVWKYSIPDEPLPKVEKYCGVFETLGEKRLASHLLPGLEVLLPLFFPSITLEQVLSFFPADRLTTSSEGDRTVQPTWSACCTGGKKCSPINMCDTPLPETALSPTNCPAGIKLNPQLLGMWCQTTYALRQTLPLNTDEAISCGSLTALLIWQLGWEVGAVKRILEASNINWGYFFDHNPFEPHCNSHPNNFIVLPPGSGKLLAPVDFDLAFSRQSFISPYSGAPDNELFDSWLASENTEMERALAGEQANTGVAMVQAKSSSLAHGALSWALHDTLLTAYRTSYNSTGRDNPHPVPPRLTSAMDALVRLSLISTHSNTA